MHIIPEMIEPLLGGTRPWFDVPKQCFVDMSTMYLPYGCRRRRKCTFCGIQGAVRAYRDAFYEGNAIPPKYIIALAEAVLQKVPRSTHTLAIFNGGSFLNMSKDIVTGIIAQLSNKDIRRLVIESHAKHVTHKTVGPLIAQLKSMGISLTVRIGVETGDEFLRNEVLGKNCSDLELTTATKVLHTHGALVGGYTLIQPIPLRMLESHGYCFTDEWNYDKFTLRETVATTRFIFEALGMDEMYLGATCIAPGTLLEQEWRAGRFSPPSLNTVVSALRESIASYGTGRIHLLPFTDEPPFLAIPSNHEPLGADPSATNMHEHDIILYRTLDTYRRTMDTVRLQKELDRFRESTQDCKSCK